MPPDSSGVVAAPPAPSEAPAPLAPADRITGYDLARALAILGMVLVHFTLVMSFERLHEDWLSHVVEFLDGRAAATFVVLAGVGLTLRSRRAALAGDEASLRGVRVTLIKRALFLLGAGYVNLLIWSGDILRVYGVSLLFAARFLRASNRSLWVLAIGFVAVFVMLFAAFDYSRNWDWRTLEYHGLWTSAGATRNLFYDGFRSVFPWTGLLFFGMWLGRQDLRQTVTRLRFLAAGLAMLVAAELSSRAAIGVVVSRGGELKREEATFLFGTGSMPPLPPFLLSAAGTAVAVIAASVAIAERFPSSAAVRALVATGQLAFTWYVGHILIGLGGVTALGLTEDRPLAIGFATGAGFFAVAALLSLWCKRRFRHGPLEWLMRRVAG